ncbi:prepilin-type N-terminal cleavage/methylation domain-containing protein [Candidatus Parcubacteria bacterium]|nr:prepilin-type N-terminal cleavage/methylation domain-containing protein [Candidatus Parcubacteria bacterium]
MFKKKGFTLIELMTAVSIFAIIMVISMGSIVGIFDANRKSRSLKTVMSNLNLAVESLSKEVRFGTKYHCGGGDVTLPVNCASGDTSLSFLASDGSQITYRLNAGALEKQVGTSGIFVPVTAPELVIDDMGFYVLGAGNTNTLQPKVTIRIKGHSGAGKSRTDFTLQTLVSQRILDI